MEFDHQYRLPADLRQDDDQLSIETFLLEPFDGATPERIRLEFLRRVRDERKFESPEALKAQILRDVGRAKAYFRRTHKLVKISNMSLSAGKLKHMKALSNKDGIIAAAAMDQRGSLQKSIASAKGVDAKAVTPEMMSEFKVAVSKILTPHATAILLDPEFGLEAAKARASNAGLLLAYEETGYDNHQARPPARPAAARFGEAHRRLGRGRGEDSDLLLALRRSRTSTISSTLSSSASARSASSTRFPSSWSSSATIPRAATRRAWSSPRSSRRS